MAYRRFVYVFLLLPDWWLTATPPEICAHFPWRHHCPCASLSAARSRCFAAVRRFPRRSLFVSCADVDHGRHSHRHCPLRSGSGRLRGAARPGHRAFHGCVAGFLCCRWQLVGSPLTHCGLWRSRRRFTHSVVVVVFVAHSRQCSVICCMHSAGNIASPLCCTCELIRDAHCLISSRAVAWPDGGRRT